MSKENEDKKKELEIPVDGSLGLLAYGYKGILAWRKKRNEYIIEMQKAKKK